MSSFYDFWNKVNGEPYTNGVPAPPQYDMPTLLKPSDGYDLKTIQWEEMGRYAEKDVVAELERLREIGYNSTRLGSEMTDLEFKKFLGQTW